MKKVTIISGVFGLLVVAAVVFVLADKKSGTPEPTSQTSVTATERNDSSDSSGQGETFGQYIEYSPQALANASGERVLFFHAPWCPQCRSIENDILKDQGSIPPEVTIIKVDYDSNQELRQRYGVTLQTSFVKIDSSENLVDKYVAYDEPTFEAVKKNFL